MVDSVALFRQAVSKRMAKAQRAQAPEPSLVERIEALRGECDALIDQLTSEKKKSPDGKILPVSVLRHYLTKGSACQCEVVERLLSEKL